jgi:DUF2892 family protein
MNKFFAPNIGRRGRIARAIYGIILILAGLVLLFYCWWAALILILAGAFGLYEAKRGWCVVRACGIKTKL